MAGISLQVFFSPRNQSAGYFFLKSPIPSEKSNGRLFIIHLSAVFPTLVTWTIQRKSIDTAGKKASKLINVPCLRVICKEQAKQTSSANLPNFTANVYTSKRL